MSDTPRTDELVIVWQVETPREGREMVSADFARTLEQELAAANERLKQWEQAFETTNPTQAHAGHVAACAKYRALTEQVSALEASMIRNADRIQKAVRAFNSIVVSKPTDQPTP